MIDNIIEKSKLEEINTTEVLRDLIGLLDNNFGNNPMKEIIDFMKNNPTCILSSIFMDNVFNAIFKDRVPTFMDLNLEEFQRISINPMKYNGAVLSHDEFFTRLLCKFGLEDGLVVIKNIFTILGRD